MCWNIKMVLRFMVFIQKRTFLPNSVFFFFKKNFIKRKKKLMYLIDVVERNSSYKKNKIFNFHFEKEVVRRNKEESSLQKP